MQPTRIDTKCRSGSAAHAAPDTHECGLEASPGSCWEKVRDRSLTGSCWPRRAAAPAIGTACEPEQPGTDHGRCAQQRGTRSSRASIASSTLGAPPSADATSSRSPARQQHHARSQGRHQRGAQLLRTFRRRRLHNVGHERIVLVLKGHMRLAGRRQPCQAAGSAAAATAACPGTWVAAACLVIRQGVAGGCAGGQRLLSCILPQVPGSPGSVLTWGRGLGSVLTWACAPSSVFTGARAPGAASAMRARLPQSCTAQAVLEGPCLPRHSGHCHCQCSGAGLGVRDMAWLPHMCQAGEA